MQTIFLPAFFVFLFFFFPGSVRGQSAPPVEAFSVLQPLPHGPWITPYLQYQTDVAWQEDEARAAAWRSVQNESDLIRLQDELRTKLLAMIGGLPDVRTPLHARVTGTVQMEGFHIEKLIFESLPGVYVTALLYVPKGTGDTKHPAILVPAGHASDGKAHYQALCQRLVQRGYVVLAWDPFGQGERSQFWDSKSKKSRYNLICAEHAVLGNLAYLAGTNLARWEIWDGLRAFDYLLTRPEVDPDRINITGTSGGGFQAMHIAALEPRIRVAAISCYITALPMRVHNRIFKDPDSDPEQDLYGMISNGVDHAGLLLLMYPRPVFVAAAVLDFFPIEGSEKTFREVKQLYSRFGHADRISMIEGYHGHEYSPSNQEAAFEFLDHFNRLPPVRTLAPVKELEGTTLQCTQTGQVMVDNQDARPLTDLIRDYYTEHKNQRSTSIRELYLGQGYPGINKWTVSTYDNIAPVEDVIAWEKRGTSTVEQVVIDRFALHHSHGLVMPLLHIYSVSNQGKRWLMWFTNNGKLGRNDWPEIRKQVDAGYDIVTFDFRGLGETRMLYNAVSEDDPSLASPDGEKAYVNPLSSVLADYVYNSLLTGRPYFLQMIEDVEIALRFSEQMLHASAVSIKSDSDSAALADAITHAIPGLKHASDMQATFMKWSDLVLQRREQWPIQYLLPSGAYVE
ncbi:MAG TPA: acetylxylan esterase [Candidatus Sulfotelmatobacter sp.]|nr:acetylxylan esterase [Candidatus Sulfotelmatobacter sp.]